MDTIPRNHVSWISRKGDNSQSVTARATVAGIIPGWLLLVNSH